MADPHEPTAHQEQRRRAWYRKKRFLVPACLLLALSAYLLHDFYPPSTIGVVPGGCPELPFDTAPGLIVQGFDPGGALWATRGMWAYRLADDGSRFNRKYRIPTGATSYWLWNFTLVRRLTGFDECVELLPLSTTAATALSAGWVWQRNEDDSGFRRVFELRHYGRGAGRGAMLGGFTRTRDGTVLLGEYFRNPGRTDVKVYASPDGGNTWTTIYTFDAGVTRHVHAVAEDPFTGKVWVFPGDTDEESIVLTIERDGENPTVIGTGAQRWRVVQAAFAEDAVYWGADTSGEDGGLWRWDRGAGRLERIKAFGGVCYYAIRLNDGTLVFSVVVENVIRELPSGLWLKTPNSAEPVFWELGPVANPGRYAVPRLARSMPDGTAPLLAITCLNIEGRHGELRIVSMPAVQRFYRGNKPDRSVIPPTP